MVTLNDVFTACNDGDKDGSGDDWDREAGSGRKPLEGTTYKLIQTPKTFEDARAFCRGTGATDLASIHDVVENELIQAFAIDAGMGSVPDTWPENGGNENVFWIGLNDCGSVCGTEINPGADASAEGDYEWSDGSCMTGYTNWAPGQPGQPGEAGGPSVEDCAVMRANDGKWSDFPCYWARPFMCKMVRDSATDADISGTHLADLNGDGIDDLIVLTHGGHPSYVYLNPGDGNFSAVTPTPIGLDSSTSSGHSTSVAVADIDNDGVMDLVIGNDGTSNMIYLGVSAPLGDYSGVSGLPFGSSNGPTVDVEVGDIDGDGALDIAAANDGMPNVIYWGDISLLDGATPQYAQLALDQPDPGTSGLGPWPWSTIGMYSDRSTSVPRRPGSRWRSGHRGW